jgi:hypothetical protein
VLAGQDPAQFPNMTLREIVVVLDAAAMRDARLAWQAAKYARFAYHQPNDMPDDPALPSKPEPEHTKADEVYVRAWMRAMAGDQNGS